MRSFVTACVVACLLALSPASAKDVTPSFTDEEAQVLVNMIDLAVKSVGLQAAASGAYLAGKINAARAAAKQTDPPKPAPAAPAAQDP